MMTCECELKDKLDAMVERIGRTPKKTIPLLQAVQTEFRYIPVEAIEYPKREKPWDKVTAVKVDEEKCIKCFKCAKVCPMQINMPYERKSGECIRCGHCIDACPTNALAFKFTWQ